jgi:alpha-N-acetylglucosamine transferase
MKLNQKRMKLNVFLGVMVLLILIVSVVVWNFLKQDNSGITTDKKDTTPTKAVSKNETYKNDFYLFEFDPSKWKLDQEGYKGRYEHSSRIMTLDHASTKGKSIDAGAEVAILVEPSKKTLEEVKSSVFSVMGSLGTQPENIQNINISGGTPAVSYEMEGLQNRSSTTIFVKNNYTYSITYQTAKGKDPVIYMDGYKLLLSSYKFK